MTDIKERDIDISIPLHSDSVTACEIIESQFWHEDCGCNHTVWGVCVRFLNGRTACIPDLCTKRSDAEALKKLLDNASLSEEFLPDIVDDYLGELYGLHKSEDAWEPNDFAKKEA